MKVSDLTLAALRRYTGLPMAEISKQLEPLDVYPGDLLDFAKARGCIIPKAFEPLYNEFGIKILIAIHKVFKETCEQQMLKDMFQSVRNPKENKPYKTKNK